jgi:hypothetical protein
MLYVQRSNLITLHALNLKICSFSVCSARDGQLPHMWRALCRWFSPRSCTAASTVRETCRFLYQMHTCTLIIYNNNNNNNNSNNNIVVCVYVEQPYAEAVKATATARTPRRRKHMCDRPRRHHISNKCASACVAPSSYYVRVRYLAEKNNKSRKY